MTCTRRHALRAAAATLTLAACGRPRAVTPSVPRPAVPPARPDAVVDGAYTGEDGALANGIRTYRTVAAALHAAPSQATQPYTILVKNGRYREKLAIAKPLITLAGESAAGTILTFDDTADTTRPGGSTLGTGGSASVTVSAPDFRAENLTIENAFDYLGNRARPGDDPAKVANAQAVALRSDKGSDRTILRNVRIAGYQDTLFADAGRQYFRSCTIAGSVDFIFGAGQAVFEDCEIVSRDLGSKTNNGYVTAASTPLASPYGYLFLDSRLVKERPAMADGTVALGRPWHPSADPNAVASVVFKNCFMDAHIAERGWESMSSRDRDGRTIVFAPQDSRFFEYGSSGPGARPSDVRRMLAESEAQELTVAKWLGGWDPSR